MSAAELYAFVSLDWVPSALVAACAFGVCLGVGLSLLRAALGVGPVELDY